MKHALLSKSLTVKEVMDLVESINHITVKQIQIDLDIPQPVLARALRLDTKYPLPAKYEMPLMAYVLLKKGELRLTNPVEAPPPPVIEIENANLSKEEMENKLYWLNEIRIKQKELV